MEASLYEGTPLPTEEVPTISLADFGLHDPEYLPCMPFNALAHAQDGDDLSVQRADEDVQEYVRIIADELNVNSSS